MELNKGVFVNLLNSKYILPCPALYSKDIFYSWGLSLDSVQQLCFLSFFFPSPIEPRMVNGKCQLPVQRKRVITIFPAGGTPPLDIWASRPTKLITMRTRNKMCLVGHWCDSEREHYISTP